MKKKTGWGGWGGGEGVLGGLIHGKGNGQVSVQVVLKKMVCGWRLFA